ncbi:MAG TPA: VIT domain-containing protein [Planctomycetota bacterium]|nr:VIT domain-containing protein [Planctomycetota bacterium]
MTCDQSEGLMAELLYGELPPGERASLERHLLECEPCREDFELARAGARVEWADVPVPPALLDATLASLDGDPPLTRFLRWATAAAALFGVAVLLVTSGRSNAPRPKPDPTATAAACSADRPTVLATMQEPILGALACQDDAGRPVGDLHLQLHDVSVEILDGIAKTTVEETFENHTDRRLEGTLTFPLPSDASISRLALEVNGKIEEGTCLERERARQVFESIVHRMQDPALLEWQPGGLFKCRIFPIEPHGTKRVILAYTQTLPCFQGKMRYVYPLASEKTRTHPPGEVRISVLARFSGVLAAMASTSHHLDVQRRSAHEASLRFHAANYRPQNDFVVTLEPEEEEIRVLCHKPEGEDGYFACFATPKSSEGRTPRKYTFVLDASASISAPRLEVAKRLVRAMMERKIDGDRFEVIAHAIEPTSSGEVELRAANTFMDALRPIGGSDVLKALKAAGPGDIIYIGKGLPTFGETETAAILEAAKGLRIRTIAVGSDANLPLLERLGGMMRITPNDDVDKRVGEIAATLGSSVISGMKIEGENIRDVGGVRDVFTGERLVAVGRYRATGTSTVVVSGRGYRREIAVAFPAKEEANNPVRRLWAQRKAEDLVAQGESTKGEVTALGVKYQIMTPYTSFLVLENEQMWKDHQLERERQKQDQVLGIESNPEKKRFAEAESAAHEIETKRDVTRKVARLLELAYMAAEQNKVDRTISLCNDILLIDPNYPVAKELRSEVEKSRRQGGYSGVMAARVEELKKLTEDDERATIPQAQQFRFPSRDEWAEVSKRLTVGVIKTEGSASSEDPDPLAIHRKLATMKIDVSFENTKVEDILAFIRDFSGLNIILDASVRDRIEPDKPVTFKARDLCLRDELKSLLAPLGLDYAVTSENIVLIQDLHRGQSGEAGARLIAESAQDEFRVRVEQAQLEITKHVRDGERYRDAGMYDQAVREFENAEFKIQNMPYEVKGISDLLPSVKNSIVRGREAWRLEQASSEEERRRVWEEESSWRAIVGPIQGKADEHYQLAERLYTAGDFEKSEVEARKALALDPQHAPSRALRTEVQFILGKGKAAHPTLEYDGFMKEALVRQQQVMVEADTALERGRRLQAAGDVASANREFRRVAEISKWMPPGAELDSRRKLAMDLTSQTGAPGKPGILSQESPRLGWTGEDTRVTRLEPWKEPSQDGLSIPAPPQVPSSDGVPLTVVLHRQPKGIQGMTEELGDQNHVIIEKLRSIRISADMQNVPLTAAVDYLRDVSGLNIHISGIVHPDSELVTFKAQDALLGTAMKQLLLPRNQTYVVRDGVVLIRPVENAGKDQAIDQNGGSVALRPKQPLQGRVTAVASEIGLVIISLGKDDGVLEGDDFAVYQAGEIAARIVIDRTDRKWAVGKIFEKKSDPRVGDVVTGLKPPASQKSRSTEERLDFESGANVELIRLKMGLRE